MSGHPISCVLATKNFHKVQEIQAILSGFPLQLHSLKDFPWVVWPEETGSTYEENASIKAIDVAKATGLPALADDSGLEIEALEGKPGIQSSRFLGEKTDSRVKNQKILEDLRDVPAEKRKAKYVCAAVFAYPDGTVKIARGEVEGRIANQPKGESGFGYDPIFYLPDFRKTMAELSPEEKNRISHRALAFRKLFRDRINVR